MGLILEITNKEILNFIFIIERILVYASLKIIVSINVFSKKYYYASNYFKHFKFIKLV
jgi:hypothetical protein